MRSPAAVTQQTPTASGNGAPTSLWDTAPTPLITGVSGLQAGPVGAPLLGHRDGIGRLTQPPGLRRSREGKLFLSSRCCRATERVRVRPL